MNYITAKIGADGLLNVTASADWARANSGGKNIEAQAILYRTLTTCAALATVEGDTALADSCTQKAATLKTAVNAAATGTRRPACYRDTPTQQRLPAGRQLAGRLVRARAVARRVPRRSPPGAQPTAGRRSARSTPEKSAITVHPFPGSMEAMAHFEAGNDETGLDLLRLEWGYMLNAPYGTASTFWEGYRTDGSSDYGGSYMSAAHGWSTGPTATLTFYVLGIHPDRAGGAGLRPDPAPGRPAPRRGPAHDPARRDHAVLRRQPGGGHVRLAATARRRARCARSRCRPTAATCACIVDGREVTPTRTDDGYAYLDAAAGAHTVATCPVELVRDRRRRRHRAGDALAHARRAGVLRRVHPGRGSRVHGGHQRERHRPPRATRR